MTRKIKETDPNCVHLCCDILNKNGIIIVPTIRWYMIITRADNEEGVDAIFSAKDRDRSRQPLFVVPDKTDIANLFQTDEFSDLIITKLMPGEITLRMNWQNNAKADKYVVNHDNALVYSASGVFGRIVKTMGIPLAATTPNVSSDENAGPALSCEEAERFVVQTNVPVNMIVDGGLLVSSTNTTIVDCTNIGEKHMIEREGYVCSRIIDCVQMRTM